MPILRITLPASDARDVSIGKQGLSIGRGADNDLHLVNPWLSRRHADIKARDGAWTIRDHGSRNGTFVNGAEVVDTVRLDHGDHIGIGEVRMQFLDRDRCGLEVADTAEPLGQGTVILGSDQLSFDRFREERSQAPGRPDGDLLPTLSNAASALIVHLPMDELIEKVLDLVQGAVPSERAALLLDDGEAGIQVAAMRGYEAAENVRISRTLIDAVLEAQQGVLTVDARSDHRFDAAQSIMLEGIRSIICVPLWNNRDVIGLIYLDHRLATQAFSGDDLRLVGLMANMAAVKIENARLMAAQLEQEKLKQQMAVAEEIQRKLLPAAAPEVAGYDLLGDSWSCFEIGGDYYDFVVKEDGRLAIVIADISGKGIGAALLMAVLQASLRTLVNLESSPAELVKRLNSVLIENSPYNKFATLFYAELDPSSHRLTYVNGGHNPAILLSRGTLAELASTGPIVGMLDEATFESKDIDLGPGDTLLLYTDGVTEAADETGDEFGMDRLRDVVSAEGETELANLVDAVRQATETFADGDATDDVTLLALRRMAVA